MVADHRARARQRRDAEAQESLDALQRLVTQGAERATARMVAIEVLAQQATALTAMDYDFLYDKVRRQLVIGYNVAQRRCDESYYDLLASEARLCNFVAIAQGKLPQESWFALGRLLTSVGRRAGSAGVERLDVRIPDAAARDADL